MTSFPKEVVTTGTPAAIASRILTMIPPPRENRRREDGGAFIFRLEILDKAGQTDPGNTRQQFLFFYGQPPSDHKEFRARNLPSNIGPDFFREEAEILDVQGALQGSDEQDPTGNLLSRKTDMVDAAGI